MWLDLLYVPRYVTLGPYFKDTSQKLTPTQNANNHQQDRLLVMPPRLTMSGVSVLFWLT